LKSETKCFELGARQIETQESPEVRLHLGQLTEPISEDIERLKHRIAELQMDRSDR
jgi:hypothetical protein